MKFAGMAAMFAATAYGRQVSMFEVPLSSSFDYNTVKPEGHHEWRPTLEETAVVNLDMLDKKAGSSFDPNNHMIMERREACEGLDFRQCNVYIDKYCRYEEHLDGYDTYESVRSYFNP